MWRELSAFGLLRQALAHVQTINSLGYGLRPSSTHAQPFRPLRPAKLLHFVIDTKGTRAFLGNLSTQLRFAHPGPGVDRTRTPVLEQIRAASVVQHTENEARVCQR